MALKSINSSRSGRYLWSWFFVVALSLPGALRSETQPSLSITVHPARPLIEIRDGEQLLNFDFAVSNRSQSSLRMTEIEVSGYGPKHELVLQKTINSNGLSPSINIVAKTLIGPGETLDIFNPFYTFPNTCRSPISITRSVTFARTAMRSAK